MARSMRDIKRQIKSVQNTRQITKAMEMVAASKLRKAQEKAEAARPYSEKLKEVVTNIAAATQDVTHPMLVSRPVKKTAYLIVTSDRGLAGGYNANILRKLTLLLAEKHKSKDEYALFVIGRKGRDFLRRREYPIVEELTEMSDSPKFSDIKSIAYSAVQQFETGVYDELYICYNRFVNAISQVPTVDRLLPMDAVSGGHHEASANYEYEPSPEGVLGVLLPKYAETLIYSAVLDGKASELGAKMTAMGSATKNASKMIGELRLTYNRARQAAITQEITEIVAGANAQS
ncbi:MULTISPECIES: ATP synthase F1 subunit gamma [unclassified Paenibacillus]|uniref:ATP synthase F1 subunit gamma n=1 Tax=unclassified Paenibacillus TaxID=185978 RepID=UPI002406A3F3|nr:MULTISPECIES: ATP synthase F1 subunit gamma [unclassified Paenibacillus]MDF9840101.1 F-type H+-transporting ATPase subunit gamma [Paenibacillus sp. PastF-2]MDF9846683.1 F-type H+-transporting ATPase subunit gamma [Paenibacillus sp. PastM-2]MDF9852968.1 F-type H+-transporting ATPase subunit gamma [Paenibacillus sp. PastF-1]MDH6478527.1 F-type H+-transporting ATPase subunit gamma [Paenibacillus sp. PastH-2]MDH6505975.1 F-type H+-transporting ATPase subunit gamma [Paenibacillus sp. PastM-3]